MNGQAPQQAPETASRAARLRAALGESQKKFADRIGVTQPTVFRLEAGQPESGPISRLLDQIERDLAEGRIGPEGQARGEAQGKAQAEAAQGLEAEART